MRHRDRMVRQPGVSPAQCRGLFLAGEEAGVDSLRNP